jgi:hypothetical protein
MYCSNAALTAHNYNVMKELVQESERLGLYDDPHHESDEDYRKRICDSLPQGAVHWAEDLANAHGKELDDIGLHWNMPRHKGLRSAEHK